MASQLTAMGVEKLTKEGMHHDGGGLYLKITKTGAKSWLFRFQLNTKRRDMSLYSYHKKSNTLAMARLAVAEARALVLQKIDPIERRDRIAAEHQKAEQARQDVNNLQSMTFKICAEDYIRVMTPQWTNPKHISQWTNTLTTYAYPFIGRMAVKDVDVEHVRQILDPIWTTKTETATRVRQRIESILAYAIANKYRTEANAATWKGVIDNFYAKPEKVKQKRNEQKGVDGHHPAIEYVDVPSFVNDLKQMEGMAAKALHFTILTACRTSEARLAKWDEIDLVKKTWTIPAARMKARKEHRVALSDVVIKLLGELPVLNSHVFPSGKADNAMSDGAMLALLKRMNRRDITVHGMRSAFRDYISEETGFAFRLAEYALAHQLKDGAEKAYARGDMLAKRSLMMNAWAVYTESYRNDNTDSNVVNIVRVKSNG